MIGLFKTEVIQRKGPWRHLEAVEFATLNWVDWFNTRRLLEPIGYVPPAEYEARYYQQLREPTTIEHDVTAGIPAACTDRRSWLLGHPEWRPQHVATEAIQPIALSGPRHEVQIFPSGTH